MDKNTKPNIKKLALSELVGADYNPRAITPTALQGLRDSVNMFGLLELPVVNIKDGSRTIISGHQRVKAMIQEGITHVDCVVVNFDKTTEMSANITMNNPAVQGMFDPSSVLPPQGFEAELLAPDSESFDQLMEDIQSPMKPEVELQGAITVNLDVDEPQEADSEIGETYVLGDNFLSVGLSAPFFKDAIGIARMPFGDTEDYADLVDWMAWVHQGASKGCYIFIGETDFIDAVDAWMDVSKTMPHWFVWGWDKSERSGFDYKQQTEIVLCCGVPAPNRVRICAKGEGRLPTMLVKELLENTGDSPIFSVNDGGTALLVGEGLGRSCYSVIDDPVEGDILRKKWAAQKFGDGVDWQKETPLSSP